MLLRKVQKWVLLTVFLWLPFITSGAIGVQQVESTGYEQFVPQHNLNCNSQFPCPKELQRRVDFWIQVYKQWGSDTLVLHDRYKPYRVYSVVKDNQHGCSEKTGSVAQLERERINNALNTLADKVQLKQEIQDSFLIQLQANFTQHDSEQTPEQIRQAARQIRCQKGVRDGFALGLARFAQHAGVIDTILADYGLPKDIRYLPFVESLYYPKAYSKAGAAGLWQIMPATADWLGLERNSLVDERLDVEAATHAAAKYLAHSRDVLTKAARKHKPYITDNELHPFMITSYNYGIGAMRKAINDVYPDYVSVLQQHKSANFQVAVQNFYSSFLAARYVSQNADKYFGAIPRQTMQPVKSWQLPFAMSASRLREVFQVPLNRLKELNPALRNKFWQSSNLLPKGYLVRLPYDDSKWQDQIKRVAQLTPEKQTQFVSRYQVKRGDTACGIANRFDVKCGDLIAQNKLGKRAIIRRGQWLTIPQAHFSQAQSDALKVADATFYFVKRGDTLCEIANRFAVNCSHLRRLNNLTNQAVIYPGQRLRIPS